MRKLVFSLTILVITITQTVWSQSNRIQINDQSVFVSGMNLAWINFAQDLTSFNASSFANALDDVAQAGGNSLRWWVHVNGLYSPQWSGNVISGISENELQALETALDLAAERNIVVSICLWSFDMLQNNAGTENHERNKALLNNPTSTQSYIDNALIPMVQRVKGHNAIMCWEIFNEPEGMSTEFGWTPEKVAMSSVQRFVNLCTGAIHAEDSSALVSNGSWSFKANSDIWDGIVNQKNYYSDDELVAVGGDTLGKLDFYMVHYYDWGGTTLSPFHHPASYWELDKPIVIGEFSAIGPIEGVSPLEAYTYLYENGYAGAMSWTWTGHDGHGDLDDAAPGMLYLFQNYPEDIVISIGDGNHVPLLVQQIPDAYLSLSSGITENYYDLKSVFWDYEDSTNLSYSVVSVSNAEMVLVELNESDSLNITVSGVKSGYAYVSVKATDSGGKEAITGFNINVFDPANENLAYQKPVIASTTEDSEKLPEYAVDGDINTRWSSIYANNQTFEIDLGNNYFIGTLKLYWEDAYTREYDVQTSLNGSDWQTVYVTETGGGGTETLEFFAVEARYVKLNLMQRATAWGNSLWEVEVYRKDVSAIDLPRVDIADISIYPNPANGIFRVELNDVDCHVNTIQIIGYDGQLIQKIDKPSGNSLQLLIQKPGVYFVALSLSNQQEVVKKLVVY